VTEDDARAQAAISALRSRKFLPFETDNSTDTTSGLTVDEQLSIAQVGFEPQDIVTGAAVARLGTFGKNSLRPFRNYEIQRMSSLLGTAREHAVQQMEKQCAEIDATGVIGVHLDLTGTEQDGVATFVATGTAIRPIVGGDSRLRPDAPARSEAPVFTSSLSGQDFHLLLRNDCAPVGFVVGTSAFHFGWRTLARWAASQGRPSELVSLTSSLYGARELAVQRLQRQAARLGADGVIDVKVLERSDVWGSHVIEFVAYGTAISVGPLTASFDPGVLVMLNDTGSPEGAQRIETFSRPGSTQADSTEEPLSEAVTPPKLVR
jgi:uncharacterized protein YbjQ (UPF0145 family)